MDPSHSKRSFERLVTANLCKAKQDEQEQENEEQLNQQQAGTRDTDSVQQ